MTVKTDQLIPGEYYWVKLKFHPAQWYAMWFMRTYNGDDQVNKEVMMFGYNRTEFKEIESIDCDKSGNPIPIKPPSK